MATDERLPTSETLMRMAKAYLAQRAASSGHLRRVLERRSQRLIFGLEIDRLPETAIAPLLDDVLARLTRAGLLDDAAYAASRVRTLTARGLPAWRVRRDLEAKGLDADVDGLSEANDAETQARRYAARKRLGPFRPADRAGSFERDMRALVRAGFSPRVARAVLAAESGDEDGMNDG